MFPVSCPSVISLIILFLITEEESVSVQVFRLFVIGKAVIVQLLIKLVLLPLRDIILIIVVLLLLIHLQPWGPLRPGEREPHSAP